MTQKGYRCRNEAEYGSDYCRVHKKQNDNFLNSLGTTVGGASTGAIFGGLPGMVIGGILGYFLGEKINNEKKS